MIGRMRGGGVAVLHDVQQFSVLLNMRMCSTKVNFVEHSAIPANPPPGFR